MNVGLIQIARPYHSPPSATGPELSMESFTKIVIWTDATIIAVVFIVNLRLMVEAWLIRRGELELEATRLKLKAELINERAERLQLYQAEKLLQGGGAL